jgi:hypothetical protein
MDSGWGFDMRDSVKALLLAVLLGGAGTAWAEAAGLQGALGLGFGAVEESSAIRPMTDSEQQSMGCIVSAIGTMAAVYAVGPSEIIMLVVGGVIVPSSSSVVMASLLGTMASVGCAAGATITPLVTWAWRRSEEPGSTAPVPPVEAPPIAAEIQDEHQQGMSDTMKQGIGCAVGGGGSAIWAATIGATETLMIVAGGLLVPASSATLWLGLGSTLVAGACSLGAIATPGILWAYEQRDNIGAQLANWIGMDDGPSVAGRRGTAADQSEDAPLALLPSGSELAAGLQ